MKQAEKLIKQGEQALLGLVNTYRRCWQDACRYDSLPQDTIVVIFSKDNPYAPYLDRLFQQYQEERAAFQVWGYVGRRMSSG